MIRTSTGEKDNIIYYTIGPGCVCTCVLVRACVRFCVKSIQNIDRCTRSCVALSLLGSRSLDKDIQKRKLILFGQLCRLDPFYTVKRIFIYRLIAQVYFNLTHGFVLGSLSLGHTRSRDHRIARLVTNLGDVRLVATTKDQSLGFIYGLPLMLFRKCIL